MTSVLVDSDVILDVFFDRSPFSSASIKILDLCEKKQISGLVTPISISNIYYITRKSIGHQSAIAKIRLLLGMLDVIVTNRQVILESLESGFPDFEDALQYFSAVESGRISAIITRNGKDYPESAIPVFTPADFLSAFSAKP